MIDTTLSHYRLTAKLGEGGMGEVYRAKDTKLDREVALKVLPAALAEDPDRLARFEREAKTLAALDHPNIVHIYSVESAEWAGTEAGTYDVEPDDVGAGHRARPAGRQTIHFMTMQLVEGRSLAELIPPSGLSLDRIFELAIPLSEALAAAHDKGVVHRDLKPANIMVTDQGRVKVLDFGLAKLAQERAALETTEAPTEALTAEGKILGTMPYMSPEQLEGKELDTRSDIFSLGILLYEMATGRRPFAGDTSVSLISSIVKDTPPSVDTVRAELPHHLARIVNRCLEKDPKRRYQSAIDVFHELDILRREVESGIVTSGVTQPTTDEMEAARSGAQPISEVADPAAAAASPMRRWWPLAFGAAVVLIAALAFWLGRDREPPSETAPAVSAEATAGTPAAASAEGEIPGIVVLPFQNRGQSEDEYFADGMSEEITTRLASISGLRVVSSASAMQYKENRPPLKQIAEELDVDYVLDGSVRWARGDDGSRVRITPQLVRTADDSQLWAESYDRVMEDVFEIQSEIASVVVDQLGITLLEPDRQELATRPTDNLQAYQAFLRARFGQESSSFSESIRRRIIEDLETAVDLDPGFTLAWAALAHAHSFYYRLGYDFTQSRRDMAKAAYDKALSLDSQNADVLYDTAFYHYYVEQDYDAALEKLAAAAAAKPNDPQSLSAMAFVWRRQGKLREGLERLERCIELSPRNSRFPALAGEYAMMLRQFPRAAELLDTSISLAPDEYWPYLIKALVMLMWHGETEEAWNLLESLPPSGKDTVFALVTRSDLERIDRDFETLAAMQEEIPIEWYEHQNMSYPKSLVAGEAHLLAGDAELARARFEAARTALEQALAERPDDYRLQSALGITLAGLGRHDEAVAAGESAIETMPINKDLYIGQFLVHDLAITYTYLGEVEKALDQIDLLLSIPSGLSVALLEADPRWDGLRDHPRYREIVRKYS